MASGLTLIDRDPVRALVMGYPGAGKTGALACLANAGFKLRVLNYGGNPQSLLRYTKRECLKNIDVLSFADKTSTPIGANPVTVLSANAYINGLRAMDRWRYEDPAGEPDLDKKTGQPTGKFFVDLGASKEWGPDTVVVLDTTSGQGEASFNRAMSIMNKTPLTRSQPMWGLAIDEQLKFIKRMLDPETRHHTIVISHLKMVGPKGIEAADETFEKELKEKAADMVPTRLYPKVLGWDLPQNFAGEFPISILVEQRKLKFLPRKDMDLKLPVAAPEGLSNLGVEDGLLKIFAALGAHPPKAAGQAPAH